jgi:serine phosphatase RsbU (regulator of sigma subunit)
VTRLALPPAWTVLLYTDGLVEGHAGDGSGDRYGLERLIAQLQRETRDGLDERALNRVLTGVMIANGGPLPDDVAVLCVSRTVGAVGRETE